jgi:hypothetical protein
VQDEDEVEGEGQDDGEGEVEDTRNEPRIDRYQMERDR